MTFKKWLESKGLRMKPWQMKAANALLTEMRPHRSGGSGKTYLMERLTQYVNECGNRMMLETEASNDRKQRGHDGPITISE